MKTRLVSGHRSCLESFGESPSLQEAMVDSCIGHSAKRTQWNDTGLSITGAVDAITLFCLIVLMILMQDG